MGEAGPGEQVVPQQVQNWEWLVEGYMYCSSTVSLDNNAIQCDIVHVCNGALHVHVQ